MYHKRMAWCILLMGLLAAPSFAAIQYSNDFNTPSDPNPSTAWPELVDESTGGPVTAQNGRIEWTGGSNHWLRLDMELPLDYEIEFDFFYQEGLVGRFSLWPMVEAGVSDVFVQEHYFLRNNTNFFDGRDNVPSEGERDLTLPFGAEPHRIRVEVRGNNVALLFKENGQGGFILIDEREFSLFEGESRFLQFGFNLDSGDPGLVYVDNMQVSYVEQSTFSYSNDFNNPSDPNPSTAWPELVDESTDGPVVAEDGRIVWPGGSNHWLRLDQPLPEDYVIEFDFFYQEGVVGRFSLWPMVEAGVSNVFDQAHYFLRNNTNFFDGRDNVPSEGERDLSLPIGEDPHRIRAEVSGNNVTLLFQENGVGGLILIDEREFPPFEGENRFLQFGFNLDSGDPGLVYIDNMEVRGLPANRANASRDIKAEQFQADTPIEVELLVRVTGDISSVQLVEDFPKGWSVSNISNNGQAGNGLITWNLDNLDQALTLTYSAIPPRLVTQRTAFFSGTVGEEPNAQRVDGETSIDLDLPFFFRQAIDYDFSGSPVDGRNYPDQHEFGENVTEGMDGIPSDVAYERPTGDGSTPEIDQEFTFPEDADFHQANPDQSIGDGVPNNFRDEGEVRTEDGSGETRTNIGGLSIGDWFRYTFDFGDVEQAVQVNVSLNSWNRNPISFVDVYLDNQFQGEIRLLPTGGNFFQTFTVGPFLVPQGEHSIVLAIPDVPTAVSPVGIERLEVVNSDGIARISRELTDDGFFEGGNPLEVTLNAEALLGTVSPFISENIPQGVEVSNISNNGTQEGNTITWSLSEITDNQEINYTLLPPEGSRFLIFNGLADIGLPLAESIRGDSSVVNEVWIFGGPNTIETSDEFTTGSLQSPWESQFGTDPALDVDFQEGVFTSFEGEALVLEVDSFGNAEKFDEWANGRRAPMITWTEIPDGDWRIETDYQLVDTFTWDLFQTGIFVAYNQNDDEDVSGDEYLFGFHSDDLRVELTNERNLGELQYHNLANEGEWLELLFDGDVNAKLAITRRGDELIFSAQLPGESWQLAGEPVTETREATRLGLFTKLWGDTFAVSRFENFIVSDLEQFVSVNNWSLY